MQASNQAFRVLTGLVLAVLFLPDLFRHGLFMDGTQYAVVSKHLAEGIGSFWFPYLSSTWNREGLNAFMEQPPLFYLFESAFFRLFGDHYYTEKLFCLFNLLLSAVLIHGIWTLQFKEQPRLQSLSWLPVLLWFIIPTVSWVYRNNLIESCLSVFVLASAYFSIRAMRNTTSLKWLFLFISGCLILASVLIKGLPGLFPLVVPLAVAVTEQKQRFPFALFSTLVMMAVPLLIGFWLWHTQADARASLSFYIEHRLLNRIQHDPTVSHRFLIVFWLLLDLLPVFILSAVVWWLHQRKNKSDPVEYDSKKHSKLFFLIGLAGVLPLCLTKVQREMYYVPALPFLSMAVSAWLAVPLTGLLKEWRTTAVRALQIVTLLLLLTCMGYCWSTAGTDARDHQVLQDVRTIGRMVGPNQLLFTPYEVYSRWDLQFYLLRYYGIEVSGENSALSQSRLYNLNRAPDSLPGYSAHSLNTLRLFKRDSALIK